MSSRFLWLLISRLSLRRRDTANSDGRVWGGGVRVREC